MRELFFMILGFLIAVIFLPKPTQAVSPDIVLVEYHYTEVYDDIGLIRLTQDDIESML